MAFFLWKLLFSLTDHEPYLTLCQNPTILFLILSVVLAGLSGRPLLRWCRASTSVGEFNRGGVHWSTTVKLSEGMFGEDGIVSHICTMV